ncbi:hypothetical protein [Haloferula sp. BvORR071]|uniref:hypothetical protein n=1 Tax=Haloferula sp. BvORR071 TaxID=1396141 RepID=UPI00054F3051|nr:hypothetical protein [Haloferula sp. BvORR071]
MNEDPHLLEGEAPKEAMDYLSPLFETALATVIADREKIRSRAWQALGLAGALVAFFSNLALQHYSDWPLPARCFCIVQAAVLLILAARLAKATWLPKNYACPGEEPQHWLHKDFIQQNVADIMLGHARRVQRALDFNRTLLGDDMKALGSFVRWAILSPIIPACLAVLCSWASWR